MRKLLLTILLLSVATLARADVYCIGQWVWNKDNPDNPYWEAPHAVGDIVTGSIDLRSIPQMSLAGGTPQGRGLFIYQSIPSASGLTCFANKDITINSARRTKIENALGISGTTSTTLKDLIYEILALKGDPTGVARWKPLMPGQDGKLKVIGGRGDGVLKTTQLIPFKGQEWKYVLATIQEDYRQMVKNESFETVGRWLDKLQEDYKIPYDNFIPDGVIKIAALPHHTTIMESFNTADSDTLGPDLSWTELEGDTDVVSNQASITGSAFCTARADSDLSSVDHYSQVDVVTQTNASSPETDSGVMTRKDSSATLTYYTALHYYDSNGSLQGDYIQKRVSGTVTNLTNNTTSRSTTYTLKSQANGSTIKLF